MTDDDPIADQLSRLTLPAPSAARLHYAAGFAAGRRRARAWQLSTAAVAALAAVVVARRPPAAPVFVERVVYVRPPAPVPDPPPVTDAASMLRLQRADVTALPISGGRGNEQAALGPRMGDAPGLMN